MGGARSQSSALPEPVSINGHQGSGPRAHYDYGDQSAGGSGPDCGLGAPQLIQANPEGIRYLDASQMEFAARTQPTGPASPHCPEKETEAQRTGNQTKFPSGQTGSPVLGKSA